MAVFYTGYRTVLKGRNANDNVNPYTGEVGVYSNYSIYNTSHVLDGAPNEDHVPGEGRHPGGVQMSRWFLGTSFQLFPIRNSGDGPELTWRINHVDVYTKRQENGTSVFHGDFGHLPRETDYSLWEHWTFRGVGEPPLDEPGHTQRGIDDEGTANTFGTSFIYIYKGIPAPPMEDPGHENREGYDYEYGHNKPHEWRGVPSAKALP